MAWRPYAYVVGGELTFEKGKAKGFVYLLKKGLVKFNLEQDYIISGKIRFEKQLEKIKADTEKLIELERQGRNDYLEGFLDYQTGTLGDFTTGKDSNKYVDYFYFEWYSKLNGRCVYEGSSDEVTIIEPLIFKFPPDHRKKQQEKLVNFITSLCKEITSKTRKPVIGLQFPFPKETFPKERGKR